MKKLIVSTLLAACMLIPMTVVNAQGNFKDFKEDQMSQRGETFRVLIETTSSVEATAVEEGLAIRNQFGNNVFTTDVTEKEFQILQNTPNLKIERVPKLSIQVDPGTLKVSDEVNAAAASQSIPWGIKAIYNDAYLTQTSGGNNIRIAVLDTGVNVKHADLYYNAEQCKDFTQAASLVNGTCTDNQGHGTHVAGTALAEGGDDRKGVYGVAPGAKLWAYKVLGDDGTGYADDIANAIRHVADQATAQGVKVVINMSLGSNGEATLITNAVNYAYGKDVFIVAASGNDGYAAGSIDYPAALSNTVAVANLENKIENGTYRVSNSSSRGVAATAGDYVIQKFDVELSAPGTAVFSTWNNGGYATISGTSMATPHVAGLAAKVWAENPGYTNVQLRSNLQNRAKTYDIRGGFYAASGDDIASGFGFARVK